ncbi:hypothetical protein G6711_08215, partial [Polynucleobacter paneuropaeus]|nr:hypothetical protein [Polynucleobacter paneuropaeus]
VTITKASLTVTANAAAMTYGASVLPSFSATITGFVGSDTSSAVTGTASFSTNATPYNGQAGSGSSVGTYSITPALGSLASGNYSFGVFSQGSLVVNKGNLTITASNDSKVYGASSTTAGVNYTAGGTAINSTAGYTTSGLVNGDTITAVTLTSTGGAVPTNVGTYTITPSALVGGTNVTNSNYTISYINASTGLAVNPKVVTLAATKTYDATNALNTVVISGLIGSQTLTYSGATTNDVNVATTGKYLNAITLGNATDGSGGLAANYALPSLTVASANNAVTITPKSLTVTGSTAPNKVYDGTTTVTLSGGQLVGVLIADTANVTLTQAGTFASANAGTGINVVANDSISGSAAGNYALVQPSNTIANITPKNLTVTGTTVANKVYDGTGLATLTGGTLVGVVAGDTASVSLTQAGVFAQWNTGGAIAVLPNDSISGSKAANYTLTQPTGLGADITPRPLGITVTGVYNGTNAISVTSFTTNGLVTGEAILTLSSVSVSNPNVAATGNCVGALLAYTGNTSSGSVNQFWGSNYSITNAYNPTAGNTQNIVTITKASLTVTANAAAMTYGASVLPSFSATITGFVGSDTSSA